MNYNKYARIAMGMGMNAFSGASARYGRANTVMGLSTGIGAAYGATLGRDRGQSRLGGAITGGMGGALVGGAGLATARYGAKGALGGSFSGLSRRYGTARAFGADQFGAARAALSGVTARGFSEGAATLGSNIAAQMRMDRGRARVMGTAARAKVSHAIGKENFDAMRAEGAAAAQHITRGINKPFNLIKGLGN